ncbi:MAG TPA: hypothetical protein VLZ50_00005, partial [Terracidiphilus sp.]|nr:hypothetical protein [Terracidiphilus sp.]
MSGEPVAGRTEQTHSYCGKEGDTTITRHGLENSCNPIILRVPNLPGKILTELYVGFGRTNPTKVIADRPGPAKFSSENRPVLS